MLLSWNTYGWRNAGVNHILIFEIDPRNHLNYLQLLTVRPAPLGGILAPGISGLLVHRILTDDIRLPVLRKLRVLRPLTECFYFQLKDEFLSPFKSFQTLIIDFRQAAMLFLFLWGVTLLLYIFSPLIAPAMKPETWPLIFFIVVFGLLILPAPIFYHSTRFWLLRRIVSSCSFLFYFCLSFL